MQGGCKGQISDAYIHDVNVLDSVNYTNISVFLIILFYCFSHYFTSHSEVRPGARRIKKKKKDGIELSKPTSSVMFSGQH